MRLGLHKRSKSSQPSSASSFTDKIRPSGRTPSNDTEDGSMNSSQQIADPYGYSENREAASINQPQSPSLEQQFEALLTERAFPPNVKSHLRTMDDARKISLLRASSSCSSLNMAEGSTASNPSQSSSSTPLPLKIPVLPVFRTNISQGSASSANSQNKASATGFSRLAAHRSNTLPVLPTSAPSLVNLYHVSSSETQNGTQSQSQIRPASTAFSCADRTSPEQWIMFLKTSSWHSIDITQLKRLRVILSTSAVSWIQEFTKLSGLRALLGPLIQLARVEWREEQHDDTVLLEFIRCLKSLVNTPIGHEAYLKSFPDPAIHLIRLLQSDKKPGDLTTRKGIIDLLLTLLNTSVQDTQSSSSVSNDQRTSTTSNTTLNSSSRTGEISSKQQTDRPQIAAELRDMLRDVNDKDTVEFMLDARKERPWRKVIAEMAQLEGDYFWVFGHQNNGYWKLDLINEAAIQKERVPGGMTGGVEYEAMAYFTAYLRLIVELGRNMPVAWHQQLWDSGFDRVIWTARKASTTQYPSFHYELARYIDQAKRVQHAMPYAVEKIICRPPAPLLKMTTSTSTSDLTPIQTQLPHNVPPQKNLADEGLRASTQNKLGVQIPAPTLPLTPMTGGRLL